MPLNSRAEKTVARYGMEEDCKGLVLAVSGGPDSMALLHWYATRNPGFPLIAAHVHHGLRKESDREQAAVTEYCHSLGIPLRVLRINVKDARQKGETVESAARRLRYGFFATVAKEAGATHVATGHTADDQAETVLLHLIHGAGPKGLCGILPLREEEGLTLIRPFLKVEKRETEIYCKTHGVPYAVDPSNADPAYTRNRIRHEILPALRKINPRISEALGRTAEALRRQQEAAELRAAEFLAETGVPIPQKPLNALPEGDRAEVLRQLFSRHGKILSAEQTDQALTLLKKEEGSAEFDRRWILHLGQGMLSVRDKALDRPADALTVTGERTALPDGRILTLTPVTVTKENRNRTVAKKLPLELRHRQNGDKIKTPAGTRSLAKIMAEQKILAPERDRLWILTDGRELLWCERTEIRRTDAPKEGESAYFISLSGQ